MKLRFSCLLAGVLAVPLALLAAPRTSPAPAAAPAPEAAPAPDAAAKSTIGLAELNGNGQDLASIEAQRMSNLATIAFNHGDLVNAQSKFEAALALAPDNPSILINLGLIAYRQKRYVEAEDSLRRVVRANLDTELAWLILGVVYYDEDKLDEALAALAQAVVLNPKDARAHHYLGVTAGKKGWYLGAEDELRKAIELEPSDPDTNFNLAVFYLQRTPPAVELARRHYQKALDLGAKPDPQMEKLLGK